MQIFASFVSIVRILQIYKNMKSRLLISTVTLLCIFSLSVFSQDSSNIGLTANDLTAIASQTVFNTGFVAEIQQDDKNTYYAIDNSKIDSRYVKIRIINQTFHNSKIVNIGSSLDEGYILFLVNNTQLGEENEIIELFNSYYTKAINEESLMSEQEMINWMNKNDKYRKK